MVPSRNTRKTEPARASVQSYIPSVLAARDVPFALLIARKEFREMVRDGRFRAAGGIIAILLVAGLLLGWQQYRETSAQHAAARQAMREQWLGQGKKNPHSAAHYGIYAFKPSAPLTMVDRGTDRYTGVAVWLEAHKQNEFKYRPAQDGTQVERFGEVTGAMILQLLVPLLIILLAFNGFSGEREQGTLRQLMSVGVKQADLAWGKALGLGGALTMLLAPTVVIGVGALTLAAGSEDVLAAMPRMAWMMVGYGLYFGAFIGISLAVSAVARSSRVALIVLLGFWMLNGLVAPRAATDLAKALRPAPSAFQFARGIEKGMEGDGHEAAGARTKRLEAALMKKYNVDSVEALPINFNGARLQDNEEHGNAVFDRAYAELWSVFAAQDGIHRAAAVITPSLAVRAVSMAFAGADFAQHAHFAQAAEEYRRMIQRVMNEDIMQNAGQAGVYLAGDELWKKVPAFEYKAPEASWVLAQQLLSLLILGAWCGGAVLAAYWAARRLQVS